MLGAGRGNSQSNGHVPRTATGPTDVHFKDAAPIRPPEPLLCLSNGELVSREFGSDLERTWDSRRQ